MTLNLKIDSLENIIKDFYITTHIRSSIYDGNYAKILSYPEEHAPLCSIMHKNDRTKAFCAESNLNAFEQCKKEKRVIIYTCHMGLSEVVAPMWDNDIIIRDLALRNKRCPEAPKPMELPGISPNPKICFFKCINTQKWHLLLYN